MVDMKKYKKDYPTMYELYRENKKHWEKKMTKKAFLENTYSSSFDDELQKIAETSDWLPTAITVPAGLIGSKLVDKSTGMKDMHIQAVKNSVVSFGQGCEGDPLMAADKL